MPEVSIDCWTAAPETDTIQIEHVVNCLVNIIWEIARSVQSVCLKPSWVQEFIAEGSFLFFSKLIDISFH